MIAHITHLRLRWPSLLMLSALLGAASLGCGDDSETAGAANASGGSGGGATTASATGGNSAGGAGGDPTGGGDGGGGMTPVGDPVIVAVGYGGRRMRSTDGGSNWSDLIEDDPNGGDDQNLLRAVTYAQGLFVSVGWRIHTSADGVQWDERTVMGQQWCGGVAYGNGTFLCTGGCGSSYRSSDGITWEATGNATENLGCTHMRSLAYGNGVFVAAGTSYVTTTSDGTSWSTPVDEGFNRLVFRNGEFIANGSGWHKTSTDGVTWTQVNGEANAEAFGEGAYFRGQWKGLIERSSDGMAWDSVFDDGGNHLEAFAFGFLP